MGGVTGSAGKMTTKEMVGTVLSSEFSVLRSAGNLNNHFGVPLQLLRLEMGHEVAVIEMGMNHGGEIRRLAEIARPDWGVVTNVAAAHLEFFPEGIGGIAAAKRELIEGLAPGGVAFLNGDDVWVREFAAGLDVEAVTYGLGDGAVVRGSEVEELGAEGVRFRVAAGGEMAEVRLGLLGRQNVHNALAALAVGWKSGISLEDGAAALAAMRADERRGSVVEWRGAKVINDSYNSNPRALDAMVDALLAMSVGDGGRRIVVAGEMLELGPEGVEMHRACGARMKERGVDLVVGVRGLAKGLAEAAGGVFLESAELAGEWMKANARAGDAVLVKGSRGVRLERALAGLGE